MRAFIYDEFGYFPDNEDVNEFDFNGWHFKLVAHDLKNHELESLNTFMKDQVETTHFGTGVDIVKSREDTLSVESEFGLLSLVGVKIATITLEDLYRFHQHNLGVKPLQPYTFSHLIDLWEEKLLLVEEKLLPSLKIDDFAYKYTLEETVFSVGLANNAVQYLEDARHDFGEEIKLLSYAHKRLTDMNSFDLNNPFNLVIDSPARDLAGLFKSGYLSIAALDKQIQRYNFQTIDITLLFARILFPTYVLDLLEDHYSLKREIKTNMFKLYQENSIFSKNIKQLHALLTSKYNIRPISWIDKLSTESENKNRK